MTAPARIAVPRAPVAATKAAKRVLYVEGNADGTIGGSYFSLLFLVKNVDHARYAPIVIFSTEHGLVPAFRAAGAEVIIRPPRQPVQWHNPALRPFRRAVNLFLGFVVEAVQLARFLRARNIALVHLNNSTERNHAWMLAAMLARVPRISHERGINPRASGTAKWLGGHLDAVICISGAVRQNLERLGVAQGRLTTIWNGLDPSELEVSKDRAAVLAEFGLPPATRLIGMVGNIRAWKGQAIVLQAMEAVAREHPDVVCLLIGGYADADARYKREIDESIAQRHLERHVIVTGYRANVADYVAALDVLIHASILPEPFGRVLLEGMALRKPLVASNGGAVPEIVQDGATGLLFTPGDAGDLAGKLLTLLRAPERARAMGEAGFARLQSQFGIRTNSERTMELYRELIGQ